MKLTADKAKILTSEAREKADKARRERVPEVLEDVLRNVERYSKLGLCHTSFYVSTYGTNVFSCDVDLLVEELTTLGFKCAVESSFFNRKLHVSWSDD